VFNGPVSLLSERFAFDTDGSFEQPITDPGTSPTDAPLVCVHVNVAWQEILAGCALQVCMPATWGDIDDPGTAALVDKAHLLVLAIARADTCPEAGMVSVTISGGSASGSAAVAFPTAFAAAPVVVVSCDNPDLIASFSAVTAGGFTATITANVVQSASVTANVSWIAMAAS
jgi:hypothetical protein